MIFLLCTCDNPAYPTYAYRLPREVVGDTDSDTTDDEDYAGRGKFSHGLVSLSHHHWVLQVVSAGCFNLHNTEGPEAHHKLCMALASSRVRHLSDAQTKESMLQYLFMHQLFTELNADMLVGRPKRKSNTNISYGVRVPLRRADGAPVLMRMDNAHFGNVTLQGMFLHSEAMLARFELLDLVCDLFGLPRSRSSYQSLHCLSWYFGQKLIRRDGQVFWATNSHYTYAYKGKHGQGRRRDCFAVKGTEVVDGVINALCMEAVVFVTLGDMHRLPFALPARVTEEIDADTDTLTLILGRWFEPHRNSISRDNLHRPICSGPLRINHCLWRYAVTSTLRRSLCSRIGTPVQSFARQATRLGFTEVDVLSHVEEDAHAYFGLFTQNQLLSVVNMCPKFKTGSVEFDYGTWLQSVTMI